MFDAKKFLADVSHEPGVYRMYDDKDQVIYVGKAKDLKKRLSSYFRKNLSSKKTEALVSSIHHIDTTITSSETEALLLEHNFIKQYVQWAPTQLENLEKLEQLRVLWYGERIHVELAKEVPAVGVDTAEDLEKVRSILA